MQDYSGYLTLRDAAAFMGTTPLAVYRFVTRHCIPTRRAGRTILVRLIDLSDMRVKAGTWTSLTR